MDVWYGMAIAPGYVSPTVTPAPAPANSFNASRYKIWAMSQTAIPAIFQAVTSNGAFWDWTSFTGTINTTLPAGPGIWMAIKASSDGKTIAVLFNPTTTTSALVVSRDYGVTWANATAPAGANHRMAMSANGTVLAVLNVLIVSQLCISRDGGLTWNATSGPVSSGQWTRVTMSDNGQRIAVSNRLTASNGAIWLSNDGGNTWSSTNSTAGVRGWSAVAMSADGMRVLAVASAYNNISLSYDGGQTWASVAVAAFDGSTTHDWRDVACSADGLRCVAVAASDYVYVSLDGGWTVSACRMQDDRTMHGT